VPEAPDEFTTPSGRRLRAGRPGQKTFTQDEFDQALAAALKDREQEAIARGLQQALAVLEEQVEQIGKRLDRAIDELRTDLKRREDGWRKRLQEVSEEMEERAAAFRLADVGPFEAGKLPDLMRWWATNEPVVRVMVQRQLAATVTRDQESHEWTWRNLRWGLLAAFMVAGGAFFGAIDTIVHLVVK
jgi:hypothetical protein